MTDTNWQQWLFRFYVFYHILSGLVCLIIPRSYIQRPFNDRTIVLFGDGIAIMWEIRILGMAFLGNSILLLFKLHRPSLVLQILYACLCLYQIVCFDRLSNVLIMAFNMLSFLWNFVSMLHPVKVTLSSTKSTSSTILKVMTLLSMFRLAMTIWLSTVNLMCILQADFLIFMQHDVNVATIERAINFYCKLLGTPENPSMLASLPNEVILPFMMLIGWCFYLKFPNRLALLSALSSTIIVINALPTFWMLMNVCNCSTNPQSVLLTGAIIHLFCCCLVNTSILADIRNFNIFIIKKKKENV